MSHPLLYPVFFFQGYLHTWTKLLEIINVDFDVIDQILIRYCLHLSNMEGWGGGRKFNGTVDQLFMDPKRAYQSRERY